jgi:hypothetical protein
MRFLWQWPTAVLGIDLVGPLNIRIDSSRLAAEYAAVSARFRPSLQHGPHHDGGWNRLGLIAPGGDRSRSLARPGEVKAPTAVLALMPTVAELIEALGQEAAARSLACQIFDMSERLHAEGRYAAAFRRQRQLALRSGTVFEPEAVGTLRARQQANQR